VPVGSGYGLLASRQADRILLRSCARSEFGACSPPTTARAPQQFFELFLDAVRGSTRIAVFQVTAQQLPTGVAALVVQEQPDLGQYLVAWGRYGSVVSGATIRC